MSEAARVLARKERAAWCAVFEGAGTCVAPVLSLAEAPGDPQHQARDAFVTRDGVLQPTPAPRFSRTEGAIQRAPPEIGEHTREIISDWLGGV